LAEQFYLFPIQISEWKNQLAESAGFVFSKAKQPTTSEDEIKTLHAKIGQLTIEREFFRTRARSDSRAQRKEKVSPDNALSP